MTQRRTANESQVCPRCGSSIEPVPIVYGYPAPETSAEARAGTIRLGGCVMTGDDPTHVCPICDADLTRDEPDGGLRLHYRRRGEGTAWS